MHRAQAAINRSWSTTGRDPFELGVGISTGKAAAALLGSEERLEYTLVGDTVNLAQRLQDLARPEGVTVVSEATWDALSDHPDATRSAPETVKGRATPVVTYRIEPAWWRSE
jgi:class 3 adenylate cyclase